VVVVRVVVTLKPMLLDSAGKAVGDSLQRLGYGEVEAVRVGKVVELRLESYDEARVREMCERLLANPVTEDYQIEVVP
jgi:phosphoribosylformylglycinamidine synthase PurS subunit